MLGRLFLNLYFHAYKHNKTNYGRHIKTKDVKTEDKSPSDWYTSRADFQAGKEEPMKTTQDYFSK
jgi:hypothetical protein